MGYNATVVVYNDAPDQIAPDRQFGVNLAAATMQAVAQFSLDLVIEPAGKHCNAAMGVRVAGVPQRPRKLGRAPKSGWPASALRKWTP